MAKINLAFWFWQIWGIKKDIEKIVIEEFLSEIYIQQRRLRA